MNEVIKTMIERRSCKKYRPDPVDRQIIDQIIEAGLYAANGRGLQSPIVLAITDKETRDALSKLNAKFGGGMQNDPFYGAPVVLVVLADKNVGTAVYDGSLVIGNMMLAAHSLGVGSCWIHRAKECFEDEEGKALLKKLGIEGEYVGVGNCIIGHPEYLNTNVIPRKPNRVYYI